MAFYLRRLLSIRPRSILASSRTCFSQIRCLTEQRTVSNREPHPSELEAIRKVLMESGESSKERLLIGFTCKACLARSHHMMGKLAYTKGTVIIQCPHCKNRHLMADHLNWFDKEHKLGVNTIEQVLEARGETVKRSLDEITIEFEPK